MARRVKGEGSIYPRSDGKGWIFEITIDGKKYRRSAKTQTLVIKKKNDFLKNIYLNKVVEKNNITLKDIVLNIENRKLEIGEIGESSYIRNLENLDLLKRLGIADKKIQKITESDLDEFTKKVKSYSNSTIQKVFGVIRFALAEAERLNIISYNIMNHYRIPRSDKEDKKVRALTIEEQRNFLKVIPESKYYMQFLIAIHTGMRMRRNKCITY